MSQKLTEEIVKHIFSGFGIIKSSNVDLSRSKSLNSKDFLLPEKIVFEGDQEDINKNLWGCKLSSGASEITILLADCSEDSIPEFALLVHLKDSPAYACYISLHENQEFDSESMIAFAVDKSWATCQTFLQATFLAGLEQAKDTGLHWNRCTDYKQDYNLLLSFIKYHHSCFEENF